VNVPPNEKSRYRARKGEIETNVLAICSPEIQFIYILPGWEGSATDSRVPRIAVNRRNGLKVPHGFLAPYIGQIYHLNEWRVVNQPTSPKEFFNMKHSSARNVIEIYFGLL
ncbi:DDE_4 domain-containing protein, partial [Cephalotus follicularis]